ncbi:TPA: hypothetical protein N0F65_012393 [Lagenidium giganteum]|uniref:N(6)-L-threonylcarbamoyladenine synthase n=1 Tax=Lagenidium giganteum TaxID=4803 RepID=A0AAV2YSD5_9STRA|nr:TPA: hypothetical protein N0F65_012393 [Lagenidium giganteum]
MQRFGQVVARTARGCGNSAWHVRLLSATAAGKPYILGIETSCDDTAAAVLDASGRVLSHVVSSQWELNAQWKGIVPGLAARAHAQNLPHVVSEALRQSGLSGPEQLEAVAVTRGPGLAPCLDVGLTTAKQLAIDHGLQFVEVNHLEAHVLVARLPELELNHASRFPFLVLLVSGGHCCLVLAKGVGDYELLGSTVDDSVGEAFDKVARMLDLPLDQGVHGGKLIEDMARLGNDRAFAFPESMKHRKDCDFSYSGMKTAMMRELAKLGNLDERTKQDLCASFQRRAVDQLLTRTRRASEWARERTTSDFNTLVICGGVAANAYIRDRMLQLGQEEALDIVFPPPRYCTDNGVMIAWAGLERIRAGVSNDPVTARYQPRWPLETLTPL